MEKIYLTPLLFQSIPESIVYLSASLILFGYNVRDNFKKVALIGMLNSLLLLIIRAYLPFGFHTFSALVIITLGLWKWMKINLLRAVTISAFGIVILGILESIFTPLWLQIFNLSMNEVLNHPVLRILIAYPHLIILSLIGLVSYKRNWYLINLQVVTISKTNYAVIIILLVHVILLIFFNLDKYFYEVSFFTRMLPFLNIFFVVSLFLAIILVKKLFAMAQNEALLKNEEQHFNDVDDLFDSYRAQRHDFNNHMQTIYGMIAATKNLEAISYLDSILDEFDELNELIRLKHSALASLLKAKMVLANSKNIDFQVAIQAGLEDIKIKPHELVNILGNLLDNAIDELANVDPVNRKLTLTIIRSGGYFSFEICNFGVIATDHLNQIFDKEFTTKDRSKHAGLGLSTAKKLVTKNGGEIGVNSTPELGTIFTVVLPATEV